MKTDPEHKQVPPKPTIFKQRYFMAKELQFSLAFVIVLALLGGIFLQAVSSALISYWKLNTPFLGFLLIAGYAAIVILLAVFFTHRLIGPFKRLEYEMKLVKDGNLSRRLSIRTHDDLHIRNFIRYVNSFLSKFEEMSSEYNRLNSTVITKLDMAVEELSKGSSGCARLKEEIEELRKQVREFREKW